MNVDLQTMLTRRADSVEAPAFDPREVVADGDRLMRRRRRLVSAGAALALALTVGTTTLLVSLDDDRPEPSQDPVPVPEWTPGTRPLAYGEVQTLHLGDREIDTGLDFLSLDLTDDGAALTTADGGIWFTDGTTVDRIGTTLGVRRIRSDSISFFVGRPPEWVVSDSAGSLLAWMEFPDQRVDRPELVVYDSGARAVVARQPVAVADRNSATVVAIAGRSVFVAEDDRGSFDPTPVLRYDVDSGALDRVGAADVEAARRGVGRALVVGSATYGEVLHSPERVTTDTWTVETLSVKNSSLDGLRDPHTGDPVEIAVPDGYEAWNLWFTQWLDDDRFAVIANPGINTGDLLVCRIAAGRCDVMIDSVTWATAPLTPGDGLVGAELALGRAMRAATNADR